MPFVKGQSGNPAGRAPGMTREQRQFHRWCQLTIKAEGWKILKNLLHSNQKEYQLKALEIILDRGMGRPIQVNQNENYEMNDKQALTDHEINQKLQELSVNLRTDTGSAGASTNTGIPPIQ